MWRCICAAFFTETDTVNERRYRRATSRLPGRERTYVATNQPKKRRAAGLLPASQKSIKPNDSRHFHISKVEAAGIEPSSDFDTTENIICNCENCQQCRAAYALHCECFKSHLLASIDADLHYVIEQWKLLDASTQRAIATYCRKRSVARYE
jgi:hypothetical protein